MFNNTTEYGNRLIKEISELKRKIELLGGEIEILEGALNLSSKKYIKLKQENEELKEDNLRLSEIEDRYQFLIEELTEFKTQLLLLLENKDKREKV